MDTCSRTCFAGAFPACPWRTYDSPLSNTKNLLWCCKCLQRTNEYTFLDDELLSYIISWQKKLFFVFTSCISAMLEKIPWRLFRFSKIINWFFRFAVTSTGLLFHQKSWKVVLCWELYTCNWTVQSLCYWLFWPLTLIIVADADKTRTWSTNISNLLMKLRDLATSDTERQYDSSIFASKTDIHMFISFPSTGWKQKCFMDIACIINIFIFLVEHSWL